MDGSRLIFELTPQDRETLKAISLLHTNDSPVRPGELVKGLDVSPATVTARLKRLHDLGLADHIPYAGVNLTEQGTRAAVTIIRRHRIVERFLVDMLGYDWEEAEDLAPEFEHALPREIVQRLYDKLDKPSTCPHGFPIPDPDDDTIPQLRSLVELAPGDVAEIAVPSNTDPEVIAYLAEIGIHPGVRVRVKEKLPFDGPVTVVVNGIDQTVGNKLARHLSVTTPDQAF
jgi:DtxR family Mn-dependent transcriptional regulator